MSAARAAVGLLVGLLVAAEPAARAEQLYVASLQGQDLALWSIDTATDRPTRAALWRKGRWPEALAAAHGGLAAVGGEEEPAWLAWWAAGARGAPTRMVALQQWKPTAVVLAGARIFVAQQNRGVWALDLPADVLQRVYDRYQPPLQLVAVGAGGERDDAAARARAQEPPGELLVGNGLAHLARSGDANKLYVDGWFADAAALFVIDAEKNRVVRVLRFVTPGGGEGAESLAGLGRDGDGTIYFAVASAASAGAERRLRLHWLDPATDRVLRSRELPLPALPLARRGGVRVAGGAVFVLAGDRLEALGTAAAPTQASLRLAAVGDGLWATPDGRKLYVTLPARHQIVPVEVGAGGLVARPPIVLRGSLGAAAMASP